MYKFRSNNKNYRNFIHKSKKFLSRFKKFRIISKFNRDLIEFFKIHINKNELIISPSYKNSFHKQFLTTIDCIRYSTIALAITNLDKEGINGSFAELGVYKGSTSRIIHMLDPNRKFYLFDTFEGFPNEYLEGKQDDRFKDTNLEIVKKTIGNLKNIIIRRGIFPKTTKGLEKESFSFILIDVDLYITTYKGLEFFYPRMVSGGYIFIHDYNIPREYKGSVYEAVNDFMKDKPERIIELPDRLGSVVFRKI